MNKKILLFLVFIISFFFIFNVNAATVKVKVNYSSVYLRTGPGTNYDQIKTLPIYSSYVLVDTNKIKNEKGCPDDWYKIYYSKDSTGFICSSYADIYTVEDLVEKTDTKCEEELNTLGFPKTYWSFLCELKKEYPNWKFIPDKTGLDFPTAVEKESVIGKSLIQTTNKGYLSTDSSVYNYETNEYKVMEGTNWYAANKETVAYYLDPRNFLEDNSIFMFEKLSYDESYQTFESVKSVLSGKDIEKEAQTILDASKENNINAIYLASRIRQETGGSYAGMSLKGTSITYGTTYYEHVYNPYNIGAYSGAYDGLVWAVAGSSYLRPWTTIERSIKGGAEVISSTYIGQGQDTIYFQKFNTSSYSKTSAYAHQYMTNVKAALSEANIAYEGYNKMELLKKTNYTFVIPVYDNMQESLYSLPGDGSANNHLKEIKISSKLLNEFDHDVFEYTYYVPKDLAKVTIEATALDGNATIENIGKIELKENETLVKIKVIAQNKSEQTYQIKIMKTDGTNLKIDEITKEMGVNIKDNYMILSTGNKLSNITSLAQKISATVNITSLEKNQGNLITGNTITIVNGDEAKNYNIVIKGDPSSDGLISIQDLLKVQKNILGYSDLSGSNFIAADTNQDGVVDIMDLLRIQKHILGYVVIE